MTERETDLDVILGIARAITPHTGRVALGQVVATPGAVAALERNRQAAEELLWRHQRGDWGDVDAEDWETNDQAAKHGGRVLSAYALTDGTTLWLITEADRSATTLLCPDEY